MAGGILPYDPLRHLTAIAPTVYVSLTLAATTRGWSVRSAQEQIAELKANPGKYQKRQQRRRRD
ncbi:MAG TPA: hypothetical protein VGN83_04205 [Falsiroseomonas sp.]|nr:hypothetical protein [Falsiroseomonas sp.]